MRLTGTYTVERIEQFSDDGRVRYPFGDHVAGMLLYSPDGAMAAVVGSADQPLLDMDLLAGTVRADDSQQAAAFRAAYGFAGTYEVIGDSVHHQIAFSTVPNWVGTLQIRPFTLEDDMLVLRPPGWKVTARRAMPARHGDRVR